MTCLLSSQWPMHYMLVQFQQPSQPIAMYVQSNLNASNRQMLRGDLSHIYQLSNSELTPSSILSISSPSSGNNSSISGSVSYLCQIHLHQIQQYHRCVVCFESCNHVASIVSKNSNIYDMVFPTQQQSFEVI